ncbi:MAG: cadC 15 [Acidobacteria bacterium]|jgi:TolB-like protein/DNA-binding winged helix-turn-helix (wHTH) protein/tetratricopeptide (TPR) repeat protein|nr:cadC 15 [Acidobacteriota bacterium]
MAVCESIYYEFFDFRVDVGKQRLLKNNQPVQLTHKAFQILVLLIQNSGQTTQKEDIFNALWCDSFVEDANLTQQIYVLRKALGQTPGGQSYIETVPRRGYRFALLPEQISVKADLRQSPETFAPQTNDFSPAASRARNGFIELNGRYPGIRDSSEPNENADYFPGASFAAKLNKPDIFAPLATQEIFSRTKIIASILFLFLAVTAVSPVIYYFQRNKQTAAASTDVKSIAVVPFKTIGDDVDKEKLGLGMADAVISRLSKLQQIVVRPTSAVFRYTDEPAEAVQAGRDLGVDAVLEGTTLCDGERVRVSVQLVRVADGKSLWAESFQEKIVDIFSVQDSISAKVAMALSLNLTKQQEKLLEQQTTNSTEAFQAFQLGIYFINKRTRDDLLKAVQYFRQAVETDSNYAQAYAGLADAYGMLGYYGFANPDEMKHQAKITAEKALSINGSLAEAYTAFAMAYIIKKENYAKAQELLERAVTLAPYNASARHRYGWILLSNGKLNEGAREMRLAQEYDPLSPATNRAFCSVLVMQRNYPEAAGQCEKTIEIYPDAPNSRRALARAYFYNGRHADAFAQLETQIKTGREDDVVSARGELGYYYAKIGKTKDAEKIHAELKQEYEKNHKRAPDLALIAFALGKKDEALVHFKEMTRFLDKIPDSHLSLAYDPYWDEIKTDARFAALYPK